MERDRITDLLAIDMGNTLTKVGYFHNRHLQEIWACEPDQLQQLLERIVKQLALRSPLTVGWASVNQELPIQEWGLWNQFEKRPHFSSINPTFPFPIQNMYQTPQTLGMDRLLAVVGALGKISAPPVLVIDIGTAVTYDVVDKAYRYLGGGISPGMRMRFQALSSFTARLPLIHPENNFSLVGNSTHESIRSGVVNGLLEEIAGIIQRYKLEFSEEIVVILSGGDASFFEKRLKSINFVEQNLVLLGICESLLSPL